MLRYEPPKAGRQSELYQMGLEHLGGDGASRRRRGARDRRGVPGRRWGRGDFVLALGHVGVFGGLVAGVRPRGRAARDAARARVESKDAAGVRDALAGEPRPDRGEALVRLTTLAGGLDVLEEADAAFAVLPRPPPGAVSELRRGRVRRLAEAGLGERLAIDLGEVRGLDYYTGLVFRAYAPGLGFEVGGGGRYDALLARFGRPMPAVGFMLGLDRLALPPRAPGSAPDGGCRAPPPSPASRRGLGWAREPGAARGRRGARERGSGGTAR